MMPMKITQKYSPDKRLAVILITGFCISYSLTCLADIDEHYFHVLNQQSEIFAKICKKNNGTYKFDPKVNDKVVLSCREEAEQLGKTYDRIQGMLKCEKTSEKGGQAPCILDASVPISEGVINNINRTLESQEISQGDRTKTDQQTDSCFHGMEQSEKCDFAKKVEQLREQLPKEKKSRVGVRNIIKTQVFEDYEIARESQTQLSKIVCGPQSLRKICAPPEVFGGISRKPSNTIARDHLKVGDKIFPDLEILAIEDGFFKIKSPEGYQCKVPQERFRLENLTWELLTSEKENHEYMSRFINGKLPDRIQVIQTDGTFRTINANSVTGMVNTDCKGKTILDCLKSLKLISSQDAETLKSTLQLVVADARRLEETLNEERTEKNPAKMLSKLASHVQNPEVLSNIQLASGRQKSFQDLFDRIALDQKAKTIIDAYGYNVWNDQGINPPNKVIPADVIVRPFQRFLRYSLIAKEMTALADGMVSNKKSKEPFTITHDDLEKVHSNYDKIAKTTFYFNKAAIHEKISERKSKLEQGLKLLEEKDEILRRSIKNAEGKTKDNLKYNRDQVVKAWALIEKLNLKLEVLEKALTRRASEKNFRADDPDVEKYFIEVKREQERLLRNIKELEEKMKKIK